MAKPFIHVLRKSSGDYAAIYRPEWKNGKKVNNPINLGRVIDLNKGIFKNRTKGVFHFDFEDGYKIIEPPKKNIIENNESSIIFGNSYVLYEILNKDKFIELFKSIDSNNSDTLLALIFFRLLTDEPYSYANSWINANYAKFLFPNCSLDSQRISEYLSYLGHNIDLNKFFRHYLEMIYKNDEPCGIIIDSTGAQNDISIDLTQINNHNGIINNEIRLIYVIDRIKKIPIYYRVIAGNIIDVTTLQNTINELKSFKVDIKYSVLDAGYYSEDNIRYLFKQNIGFVTRMIPSRLIAKELISENLEKIFHMKNKIIHNNRLLFVEKFKRELFGNIVYAYVAIDFKKRNEEIFNLANSTNKCKKLSTDELELEKKTAGTFILLSSLDLDIIEILPYYSSRNYIEQIFDVSKNNAQLLPLRVHSTEALMGHILINFLTVIGYLEVNKYFNLAKYCAKKALFDLSFLFGRVINNEINIYEPNKTMKEIAKILGIIIPKFLDTSNIYKAN